MFLVIFCEETREVIDRCRALLLENDSLIIINTSCHRERTVHVPLNRYPLFFLQYITVVVAKALSAPVDAIPFLYCCRPGSLRP